MSNAGWRQLQVTDHDGDTVFPVIVCYPTAEPEIPRQLGPYTVSAAWDGEPLPGEEPLVMLSHGSGSSPLANRDLARALAQAGFVVGMPVHAGDNRDDRSLQGSVQNLQQRPRHLQSAIDAVLADPAFFSGGRPLRVALVGHSLGAYTALALAGGQPRTLPQVWPGGPTDTIAVAHDPRVSALVLLAPAAIWFHAPGALEAVRVPVLMLAGEQDTLTPPHHHAGLVAQQLPQAELLDSRLVPGAGHFSFLSVFPREMRQPDFPPAADPPGFDRSDFQEALAEEIVKFLRQVTVSSPGRV